VAEFTQDFYTSRRNRDDGETYLHQLDRLWYDSNTNTIRIGNNTPGGKIVSSATGGAPIALDDITDVNSPAPGLAEDGYVLTWDNTASEYNLQAGGSGGVETDPIFVASPAYGISDADILNWDNETDPVFTASPAFSISSADITNWDTAFGWGDHSTAGYALTADINLEGGTLDQVLVKQSGTDNDYLWEDLNTYEPKYTKEIDDASVQRTTYLGEAAPDSLQANAVWRIQEIIFDNKGGVDSVRFASGSSAFTFVWNDRLTYTYS